MHVILGLWASHVESTVNSDFIQVEAINLLRKHSLIMSALVMITN